MDKLAKILTHLHADKQDLVRRTFSVVLFPENDLPKRLRAISGRMRTYSGKQHKGEPFPFFPAILHLFLSTSLFDAIRKPSPNDTVTAITECYATLIDYYLDIDRVQLTAEHCLGWLADWDGSCDHVAREVMRLLVPSILSRLHKSKDPALLVRGFDSIVNLGETIVRQSKLIASLQNRQQSQKDMLDSSFNLLIQLVEARPSELNDAVYAFIRNMFPDQHEFWAEWKETEMNPPGKIGPKWCDAVTKFVESCPEIRQRSLYCQQLLSVIDTTFPTGQPPRLKSLRNYLERNIPSSATG